MISFHPTKPKSGFHPGLVGDPFLRESVFWVGCCLPIGSSRETCKIDSQPSTKLHFIAGSPERAQN